jgi:AAA ATPase domain
MTSAVDLERECAVLEGQRRSLSIQIEEVTQEVAQAKGRELLQPAVVQALESLQKQEHERSVGVFGGLLSALAKDVLPNAIHPIVLDLYTAHGAPALDIDVQASEKHKEEITSGALKNVLSVGLRLIAIARTKQRRFLVLDEPDHWIKPQNVPQFVSVLDRIIKELGFQILMISHHPNEYFNQTAKCVGLIRTEDGGLEVAGDLNPSPHQGISNIRLVNFEAHTDTTIPLHEGMTVLTGENNIGKSSVIRALKALCQGETHNDRVIKHTPMEEPLCKVEIQVESGKWVGWRRARKLSTTLKHKNRYYLRGADQTDERDFEAVEDTSDGLPDFVVQSLNMRANGKWDVHVAAQEESVFLLNTTTKASERAKILSLGNEAEVLHGMIEKNRAQSRQDKDRIRMGERKLTDLKEKWSIFNAGLVELLPRLESLKSEELGLLKNQERERAARENVCVWEDALKAERESAEMASLLLQVPSPRKEKDEAGLSQTIKELEWSERWSSMDVLESDLPSIPEERDEKLLKRLVLRMEQLRSIESVEVEMPEEWVEQDCAALNGLIQKLTTLIQNQAEQESTAQSANEKWSSAEQEWKERWSKQKTCPLCFGDLERGGRHEHE